MNKIAEPIRWTIAAYECYERNCNCKGCICSELSTKCVMNKTLIKLINKFGHPSLEMVKYETT